MFLDLDNRERFEFLLMDHVVQLCGQHGEAVAVNTLLTIEGIYHQ